MALLLPTTTSVAQIFGQILCQILWVCSAGERGMSNSLGFCLSQLFESSELPVGNFPVGFGLPTPSPLWYLSGQCSLLPALSTINLIKKLSNTANIEVPGRFFSKMLLFPPLVPQQVLLAVVYANSRAKKKKKVGKVSNPKRWKDTTMTLLKGFFLLQAAYCDWTNRKLKIS